MSNQIYQLFANAVLVAHACVVLFILAGLVLILLGGRRGWPWVRNFRFRLLHLGAIGYVVAQSWFGIDCPLTTLEQWLRVRAGEVGSADDFIAHWVGQLLFYHAEPWVFVAAYSLFGLLVLASWLLVRPAWRR
ncbi:MAG: hypothetical protein JWQ01_2681 [Massilia sp.]|jgi:hypothetical protein|nr:hypothetical protein [Massilia sp.]